MDQELKVKWVSALRSGEFKQGKFNLYDRSSNTFCCLGVLGCVLGKSLEEMNEVSTIPPWPELEPKQAQSLAYDWNDARGKSFAEIADYIERNL